MKPKAYFDPQGNLWIHQDNPMPHQLNINPTAYILWLNLFASHTPYNEKNIFEIMPMSRITFWRIKKQLKKANLWPN